MFNDWLTIGPVTIHGYGVMIAIGILAAAWLAERLAKRFGLEYEKLDAFIIFVVVCGFVCSKMLYIVTVFDAFLKNPIAVLGSDGWVVYGGILGGILGAYIWCKWHKWDFMKYFYVLMPTVALAQGFGRIGCFLAGCCGGLETDAWYGIHFPHNSLAWSQNAIIPTQIISSVGDFLIFYFLYRNLTKGKHPEDTGAWYLILYSLGRFMIEFLRGDIVRGSVGPLSTSQFISVFTFLLGAYLIWRRQQKDEKKVESVA